MCHIVKEAGGQNPMQMCDPISKELIIHLEWAVDLLHCAANTHQVIPKGCRFLVR